MNVSRLAHQFIIARTPRQQRLIMQGLEEIERDPSAGEFLAPQWPTDLLGAWAEDFWILYRVGADGTVDVVSVSRPG